MALIGEKTIDQLVKGQEYRIECPGFPSRTGRFIKRETPPGGIKYAEFSNISTEKSATTKITFEEGRCRFYYSPYAEGVAVVGHSKNLPPNIERLLQKFGGGKRRKSLRKKQRKLRKTKSRRN